MTHEAKKIAVEAAETSGSVGVWVARIYKNLRDKDIWWAQGRN